MRKGVKENYDLDIFIYTYQNDDNHTLIYYLNPVKFVYCPNEYLQMLSDNGVVQTQIRDCCNIVKNYETEIDITYDYIIITRFDLTFNNKFSEYNIDFNKINMACMFVPDNKSGDIFFNYKNTFTPFHTSNADFINSSILLLHIIGVNLFIVLSSQYHHLICNSFSICSCENLYLINFAGFPPTKLYGSIFLTT